MGGERERDSNHCVWCVQQLYQVHLSSERVDCTSLMCDSVRAVLSACDCISTDVSRLKILLLVSLLHVSFLSLLCWGVSCVCVCVCI